MNLEIHTLPCISTGHMDEATALTLAVNARRNPWAPAAAWEHGCFIFLDELEACEIAPPQCLLDIRDWLRQLVEQKVLPEGSFWVRLDSDGPHIDTLPVYNW